MWRMFLPAVLLFTFASGCAAGAKQSQPLSQSPSAISPFCSNQIYKPNGPLPSDAGALREFGYSDEQIAAVGNARICQEAKDIYAEVLRKESLQEGDEHENNRRHRADRHEKKSWIGGKGSPSGAVFGDGAYQWTSKGDQIFNADGDVSPYFGKDGHSGVLIGPPDSSFRLDSRGGGLICSGSICQHTGRGRDKDDR